MPEINMSDFSYWLLLSFSFSVFILEKSCVIKNLITVTFLCTKCSLGCRINFDSQSISIPLFLACHSHISYSETSNVKFYKNRRIQWIIVKCTEDSRQQASSKLQLDARFRGAIW